MENTSQAPLTPQDDNSQEPPVTELVAEESAARPITWWECCQCRSINDLHAPRPFDSLVDLPRTGPNSILCEWSTCSHPLCNICELYHDNQKPKKEHIEAEDGCDRIQEVIDRFENTMEKMEYYNDVVERRGMIEGRAQRREN